MLDLRDSPSRTETLCNRGNITPGIQDKLNLYDSLEQAPGRPIMKACCRSLRSESTGWRMLSGRAAETCSAIYVVRASGASSTAVVVSTEAESFAICALSAGPKQPRDGSRGPLGARDTWIRKGHQAALLSVVDPAPASPGSGNLPQRTTQAATQRSRRRPPEYTDRIRTGTLENGKEFAGHAAIIRAPDSMTYVAISYVLHQHDTNTIPID